MAIFSPAVITDRGLVLSSKAVAGVTKLQFTRLVLSNTKVTGNLLSLTEIPNIKQSEAVSSAVKEDHTIKVYANFSNKDLTTGYYVRTIGLYVNDPNEGEILYSVATVDDSEGSPDWIPPISKAGLTSITIGMSIAVSNTAQVNITVDDTATVPMARFEAHLNDFMNPHKVTAEQVGAVQNRLFWYTEDNESRLIDYIASWVEQGYTSGTIQVDFENGVPTDAPTKYLSNTSISAQVKFTQYGYGYLEVIFSVNTETSAFFRKGRINDDANQWLADWVEYILADGYLPRDSSLPMTGNSLKLNNGQANFGCNEYIATLTSYKDKENPQDAYGSIWVHNDGALSNAVETTIKKSGENPVTYPLFGRHNKKSGTYKGNERDRIVEVGGIGNAVLITYPPTDVIGTDYVIQEETEHMTYGMALVTFAGTLYFEGAISNLSGGTTNGTQLINPKKIRLIISPDTGELAIRFDDGDGVYNPSISSPTGYVPILNRTGVTYEYTVL